jgi:4-hydroxybenzoyl-CoA thioesterase
MLSNRYTLQAEFGDCDPSGIVFNPNYLRWFDASVHTLLRAGGTSLRTLQDKYGIAGLPLIESHIQFSHPVFVHECIDIQTQVTAVDRCVIALCHRVIKKEALTAVKASEKRAWTIPDPDGHSMQAAPIPDKVRDILVQK